MPAVGIIMGSVSDADLARKANELLEEMGASCEVLVASAHRTPDVVQRYAEKAESRGISVLIAIAGLSAALPGVVASHTVLPVIGVPATSGTLLGMDALLSVTQMPPGVPVGSVGIDAAKNAALLALRILALRDTAIRETLKQYSKKQAANVLSSGSKLKGLPLFPLHEL